MIHEKGTCPICDSKGLCKLCGKKIKNKMIIGILKNKTVILCEKCNIKLKRGDKYRI